MAKTGALGYKENNEYTPQTRGIATIKVGESFALVTFEESNREFDNGTNKKKIKLEDMPKFPKLVSGTENRFNVRLNEDGDLVDSLFPVEGHFVAKLIDMAKGKGEEPMPFEKRYKPQAGEKEGKPYRVFYPIYKITKGALKGATNSYTVHYKFDDDGRGFATFVGNPENPKATQLQRTIDWCDKHQVIEEPISWPEDGNICPILFDRAMEADVEVEIIVKNGYIDSLLSLNNYGNDEPDEEEKTPKPVTKKAAPATKKVVKKDDEDDDL